MSAPLPRLAFGEGRVACEQGIDGLVAAQKVAHRSLVAYEPLGRARDFAQKSVIVSIGSLTLVASAHTPVRVVVAASDDLTLMVPFHGWSTAVIDGREHRWMAGRSAMYVSGVPRSGESGLRSTLTIRLDRARLEPISCLEPSRPRDRASGEMVVMVDPYGARSYRSISPAGATTELGTTTDTIYSMAFDNVTGELFAYSLTATNTWQRLDPADGSTLTGGTLTGENPDPYSSYGGNMSGAATGGFYFVNDFPFGQLIRITPTGVDGATVIIGTMAGTDYEPSEPSSPFVWGTTLHILNENRVYAVDESDASLTLLGTVSGLPGDFTRFTGAVAPVAVPEPSLWITAVAVLTFGAHVMRRRTCGVGRESGPIEGR